MDDESDDVLRAAQAGAGWALEALYRRLAPAVSGYLRVQGAAEPADLSNEVFLRVFRDLGSFSGTESGFRSWVFTIAHHRLLNDRRDRARRPSLVGDDGEALCGRVGRDDVEDDVLYRLAEERVRELCARLAPDQRDVLLLRLVGDMTVEQVAATLGKSVGATKALQRRGLAAIGRVVAREGVPL